MNEDDMTCTRVCLYAQLLPKIREAARKHGWAIGVHGSCVRDLDLMAMPWIEEAAEVEVLLKAICEAAGGFVPMVEVHEMTWEAAAKDPQTNKPHGRRSYNICFGGYPFIDLAVMPKRKEIPD